MLSKGQLMGTNFYHLITIRFKHNVPSLKALNINAENLDNDRGLYHATLALVFNYIGWLLGQSQITGCYHKATLNRVRRILSKLHNPMIARLEDDDETSDLRDWQARNYCYQFLNRLGESK